MVTARKAAGARVASTGADTLKKRARTTVPASEIKSATAAGNGAVNGVLHGVNGANGVNRAKPASVKDIDGKATTPVKRTRKAAALDAAVEQIVPAAPGSVERVRRTRTRAVTADDEPLAAGAIEVAVPVQIGGLQPSVIRPDYWDRACADLVKRDRILKKLIPQFGPVHLVNRGDPFVTLARSIVGQQISVKAAQAIWERIELACPRVAPARVVKIGYDKLFGCGLSKRKAEYILDLAQHFADGALHVDRWAAMEDEAVIGELTQIRGIGRWTAEMFLIFNLLRPDIVPLDDLGLIRAISVNYFSGEPVTRSEAREVAANWEPWRTVATWYMWRSLDPLPVDY